MDVVKSAVSAARRHLTVWVGSDMASTKLQDSVVHERTVSVRPSRYSRVMEASYVRQNLPMSWEKKNIFLQGMPMNSNTEDGIG